MPKQRTSFQDDWLKKKDANEQVVEQWCQQTSNKFEVYCRFCNRTLKCDNRGLSQLINHSQSQSHSSFARNMVKGNQMRFVKEQCDTSSDSQPVSVACSSARENVTKAELLWALKVALSNYSFKSAKDLNLLFCQMFPDSEISNKFHVGPTKLSYLISDATGPHFHEMLLYDVRNSNSAFTISYDELTNRAVKKQLDLKIRYWSDEQNLVAVHHLDTYLMGRAKGKDIAEKIMKSVNDGKLSLQDLMALGSDGPNVNKTVFQCISESKKQQDLPGLVDVGTCNLHVVHGAFGGAVKEFGNEVVDFVIDLHNFFKVSPVRTERLRNLQEELGLDHLQFLQHVSCRWLTLGPALERVLNQWSVLNEYFLKELPKTDKKISENFRYKRILKFLNMPLTIKAEINFILTVCKLFEPFMEVFQREEPLIHILHDHMNMLIITLLGRFVKGSELRGKTFSDVKQLKFPCVDIELSDSDLEIGVDTRKVVGKLKAELKKKLVFGMRRFYHKLVEKLMKKMPLDNPILQDARCLKPEYRVETWTLKAAKGLASNIPLVPPLNVDCVADEWRILQCEVVPPDWYCLKDEEKTVPLRVDQYWAKIFSVRDALDHCKYTELARLVKAVLVIPHGNADVERGFSHTSNYLSDTRTHLSQASVSALQSTKDGLKKYGYHIHKVPITKDFIKKGMNAHKSYLERVEEEKRTEALAKKQKQEAEEKQRKETEELLKKKKIFEQKSEETKQTALKERDLQKQELDVVGHIHTYKTLLEEASDRIKNSLKINDLKGVRIGQTMLEAACKKVDESTSTLQDIRNEQKVIEKSKRTLLDYFCATQAKKHKSQ